MNPTSAVSVAFDPLLSWEILAGLGAIGLRFARMADAFMTDTPYFKDSGTVVLMPGTHVGASFDSAPAYRDPEADAGVFRFGADLRDGYLRARAAHFDTVTAACRANDLPLVHARIEQAPGEVLRQWLARVRRRGCRSVQKPRQKQEDQQC